MADDNLDEQAESFARAGQQFAAGALSGFTADGASDLIGNGAVSGFTAVLKFLLKNTELLAKLAGKGLTEIEDPVLPIFAAFVTPIVSSMFGSQISDEAFTSRANNGARSDASAALVDAFMAAIAGDAGGELAPGDEGAKRIAGAGVHAALEGWFNAWVLEMLGDLVPWEWLKFHDMAALPEEIIRSLGIGRLVRRAIAPLVDATAATPMKWQANITYRPNLLSEGDIIRAFLRGDYTADAAADELARLGYSDRRQDILIKNAAKRLSVDDVQVLRRANVLDRDYALQNLRDEGYDDVTAQYLVTAAEERRLAGIRDDSLATIMRAYAEREIDDAQFRSLLDGVIDDDIERELHLNAAQRSRQFNVKHLSHGEVIECVELGVLAIPDYRRWLEREGYAPDDADALELRLRVKLDKAVKAADERQRLAAEKAKAQAAAAVARETRLEALEKERALHARGSIADLRRAVARGLIPLDRLAEVLRAEYDADTVQLLLELAEQDRADFVAQQQRADDARKRAARRNIEIGSLEQGVLHHILTVDAYRDAITERGFTPADVQILTATLAAKLRDQDAAATKRARAEQDAKVKHIDLGRFERLVRRGIRTVPEYAALLGSLGYDEASVAAMVALLQVDIDDDAKARALRDEARQKATTHDLTLEQFRRAVVLGVRTDQDFQAYLVRQHYTSDAQAVLVAELRRDVADADAARQKRQTAEATADTVDLPLSRITAAARLGIISPDAYVAHLQALGYSADDVAIEMELLLQEIADVQATRAKQAAADAAGAARGLSLSDVARAVKAGRASLNDYRARALELGYTAADAETLVGTLEAEQATLDDARRRRVTIDGELTARTLSLGQLEDAVKAGAVTLDAYQQQLETWGYGAGDAQLLAALLADAIAKKAAG